MRDRLEGEVVFDPNDLSHPNYWLKYNGALVMLDVPIPPMEGEEPRFKRDFADGLVRFIAHADPNLMLRMRLGTCADDERCAAAMPEAFVRCCLLPRHPGLHVAQSKEHERYYGPVVASRFSVERRDPLDSYEKSVDAWNDSRLW